MAKIFINNVYILPMLDIIMRLFGLCIIILLLAAIVSPSVYAQATTGSNTTAATAQVTSPSDLVTFVNQAVEFAKSNGKDNAIKAFNDKNGQFFKGALYIFAYDYQGNTLAAPTQPNLVGTNRMDAQDPNGVTFIKNMANLAKNGSGFTYYIYEDPSRNMEKRLKLSYASNVDDSYWLGAGTYLDNVSANFNQTSKTDLVSFVKDAAAYAKSNGKDSAVKAFNDKNGQFMKNGLYVFAYDFQGNTLAAPTQPDLIGTSRIDVKDPNGVKLIRDMADIAKNNETGYLYYIYADPSKNMQQRLKLSYVTKIDDTWWLGAGTYAQ
jgi:signal transduction histidine kinase